LSGGADDRRPRRASIAALHAAGKPLRYTRATEDVLMPILPARFALLLALCAAAGAHARDVYKCTTPHGVAYQDKPCAASASETVLDIAEPPPAPMPAPSAPLAEAAPSLPPSAPPPLEPPRPAKLPPPLWFCVNADDGSHYASLYAPPPPRAVPLGILGYPGKSLAQAYKAGANVMSAPEFNKPPIDNSPGSAMASQYTDLQDECVQATIDQTCAYLHQQYDKTNDKLLRARFKDEQAKAQGELDQLQGDLDGC
jgi:hypothetical protein